MWAKVGKLGLLACVLSVGCAVQHDVDASDDDGAELADGTAQALGSLPSPGDVAERIYFGAWADLEFDTAGQKAYRIFRAAGGSSFSVNATALNDEGDDLGAGDVSYKLYYLYRGHWRLYGKGAGNPTAKDTYSPTYDHTWLLATTVKQVPNRIEVVLGCENADHTGCGLAQQPGESCDFAKAGALQCDLGLLCMTSATATCDTLGTSGTCGVAPKNCDVVLPVCGCDGKTYDNACKAALAHTTVSKGYACDCDGKDWKTVTVIKNRGTTTWGSADGVVSYVLDATGTFNATYDVCAHSTCKVAVRVESGTWAVVNDHDYLLTLADGTTRTLTRQVNCFGEYQITGNDWGTTIAAKLISDATKVPPPKP